MIVALAFAGLLIPDSLATGQTSQPARTQTAIGANARVPSNLAYANAEPVLVDVVVTDNGKAVHGLERGHFHVLENGREQTIAGFEEHQPAAAPQDAAALRAKIAALPAHTYTNIPAYAEGPAVNVLLLDGLNTLAGDQMEVRRQMLQWVGTIQPGTSPAIFTLGSHLRQLSNFATDPADLMKALKNNGAGPQAPGFMNPNPDRRTGGSTAAIGREVGDPEIADNMREFEADTKTYDTDQRVAMTLEALGDISRYLSAIPGRKNLIWSSSSFPISLDPDSPIESQLAATRNYAQQIEETSDLLLATRVAVYPLDARGLLKQTSLDAANSPENNMKRGSAAGMRPSAETPSRSKTSDRSEKEGTAERNAMQRIAGATGGKEFFNIDGFKEAVANAIENGSSYYTLTYVPAANEFDGQFHKLEVRLDKGRCQLAYRRGYFADAPDKLTSRSTGKSGLTVSALQHGTPPSTQILFYAHVLPATDSAFEGMNFPEGPFGEMAAQMKGPARHYVVSLIVAAKGLAYNAMPDGTRQAQLEFVLTAYDANGTRVNYVEQSYNNTVKPEELSQQKDSGIRVRLLLDLPTGDNFLRIAVQDLAAGRAGTLETPMNVSAK